MKLRKIPENPILFQNFVTLTFYFTCMKHRFLSHEKTNKCNSSTPQNAKTTFSLFCSLMRYAQTLNNAKKAKQKFWSTENDFPKSSRWLIKNFTFPNNNIWKNCLNCVPHFCVYLRQITIFWAIICHHYRNLLLPFHFPTSNNSHIITSKSVYLNWTAHCDRTLNLCLLNISLTHM